MAPSTPNVPDAWSELLLTRTAHLRAGGADGDLRRQVRAGVLMPLRPGSFVDAERWQDIHAEQRAIADAAAYLHAARGATIVFSHLTAAAILGMPLVRASAFPVHVIALGEARSTRLVTRHRMHLAADDVLWSVDGAFGVTSFARTAVDLARTSRHETAVPAVDAALRHAAAGDGTSRDLDLLAAEELRGEMTQLVSAAPGGRGIRSARFVIEFADARADGPGESLSRLLLHRLGFPPPALQVRVPAPRGHDYEVDFRFPHAWGEFDGDHKYTDPRFLRGRTPAQVLAAEKEREDWIRGTTGLPVVRWQWTHLSDEAALGRRLAAFGLHPRR